MNANLRVNLPFGSVTTGSSLEGFISSLLPRSLDDVFVGFRDHDNLHRLVDSAASDESDSYNDTESFPHRYALLWVLSNSSFQRSLTRMNSQRTSDPA